MKRALLIGINDYPVSPLKGCVNDINELEQAVSRNGDGSKNFDVRKLPNVQTFKEVMDNIEFLFHDDADVALLYFSGHGMVSSSGAQIAIPEGITTSGPYVGIQLDEIMDVVNRSRVKHKIVILDCCYSGNAGKYNVQDSSSALYPGVTILTACRDDETAAEAGGHGLFTELLCSALRGGAADFSGNITVGGVYAYIDRSIGSWGQRPVFKTNVAEFIPLKTVNPQVSAHIIRQFPSLFVNMDSPLALDPSFEDTNDPSIKHEWVEPYAIPENVQKFKALQKLQSIGFVRPVGAEFMYFAAMQSKACELTELGKFYWRLVADGRI